MKIFNFKKNYASSSKSLDEIADRLEELDRQGNGKQHNNNKNGKNNHNNAAASNV